MFTNPRLHQGHQDVIDTLLSGITQESIDENYEYLINDVIKKKDVKLENKDIPAGSRWQYTKAKGSHFGMMS